MSRFFVGQRVVFARPHIAGSPNLGRIGVITELFPSRMSVRYAIDCRVDWAEGCLHTSQLEPVLPDGQKHMACDEDFKRDLDKLLEGLPA